MGWRNTIVFQPLIGEKDFIDKFKENTVFEKCNFVYPTEAWEYEQYKGDTVEMCREITDMHPGITFYGYELGDTTLAQYSYRQILFNKENGIIFLGKHIYSADDEMAPTFDGLSIRGTAYGDVYGKYLSATDKFKNIDFEENNNENGGYSEDMS